MCAQSEPLVHAFLDGELAGEDRHSFEMHLLECSACAGAVKAQARFKSALRSHLPRPALPAALERKVAVTLATAGQEDRPSAWGWLAFPRLTPAFGAVAVVAVLVVLTGHQKASQTPVIQQALRAHSVELPMDVETPDCNRVASWFRGRLGFTVHPPQIEGALPASVTSSSVESVNDESPHCQGGRIINVRDNFGAYLTYKMGAQHRINVMVFEGDDESLEGPRHRVVGGRDVYFGSGQGASTAAFRGRDGLNYVLTSDLDEDTLSHVLESAFAR
ncbi:MAG: zf-HC2 domain-containing protein [Deltaproteobacteria bacterium]|nr:zf-HC2 domain-containing protein [Deltaproteobacteria bacterium]